MMKRVLIAAALVALSVPAFAQGNNGGGNGGCGVGQQTNGCGGDGSGGAGGAGGAGGTGVGVGVGIAIQGQAQQQLQMQQQMQNSVNVNANANTNRNRNDNTNLNRNTATGGAGGNSGGNVMNGGTTSVGIGGSTYNFPQIPVSSAWAPALAALAPAQCVLSQTASGGLQLLTVGASAGFGSTTPYEECNTRETIKIVGSLPPNTMVHGYRADVLVAAMTMQLSGMSKAVQYLNGPPQPQEPAKVVPQVVAPAAPASTLPPNCKVVQPGNYVTCQ